ncbi:MAG: ammonium transporter, partial [Treponema sp.]|nr:ammonium transporter [Treponema sp.]
MDFSIWFLIGAALVFFMQCGFAMVESGFTRAKNSANIIMKNLVDFSIGVPCFAILGFTILTAEDALFGVIGIPNMGIFTDFGGFDFSSFVFNLVFCATAATIVSGAMAERTKFSAYCLYSMFISLVIYPVEAGWVWNENGWLVQLGYIDFAGSSAIHMVGGISGFLGAAILGARIGKYTKDPKTGKKTVRAIPGHSITLGALGTFILWFGWYGFNGAAATDLSQLGAIFLTTTLAPAVATVATMCFTWIKNGKPDVSMSLNGALAGLVAITAPCSSVNALGAIIIGLVAGILVVLAVEFIDLKLHVDDPVGAVAVHGVCGIWGTLAVGLFATPTAPNAPAGITGDAAVGLFYGGGFGQLGVQAIGVVAIAAWTFATVGLTFLLIKKINGLRAAREDEIKGLDSTEHGMSGYADFMIMASVTDTESAPQSSPVPANVAVPVVNNSKPGAKMTKVVILTKQSKFDGLKIALDQIGITGMTVTQVLGCGMQRGSKEIYRGVQVESKLLPKVKIEVVISKIPVQTV